MINIRLQRRTSAVATAVLLVSGVVVIAAAPAAQAAGASIALAKSATASALPGAPISYRLTATNPGTATEYNLSLSDVLPVGVSYQAGSSLPVGAGEPVVRSIGTPPGTQQVLVWQNIADLSVGGTYQVGFQAVPDATAFPAGATVTNAASAYTNTDPRMTPTFDSSGTVTPGTYTETATSAPATTSVVPITIAKSEPSPEGELVRGVHDNTTVYTLKVTNSSQGTTSGAQVTDYLPAGLEFLGCGGVDNGSAREYPGAPSLTATPLVPSCLAPTAVTTVNNPVAVPALPAGVYTRVTWSLGDLPGGAVQTVAYRAAVPMLANTMTFTGGTPGGVTAQGANLDNNNGAPTRETATAQSATNQASVSGTYQGSYLGSATPGATPVSGSTTLTRTLQDLALAKSVSPATFDQGGIATYTLTLRGSEYVTSSGVVLTDVIPDGLCPLDDKSNYSVPPIATCAPAPGFAPTISGSSTSSVSFASVAYDASSGSFTVVFTPVSVPRDGVVVITYQARMRGSYRDGDPTTAGDAYTNKVALTGTTTPVPATGVIGTVTVHDDSQSTIASTGPSVTKTTLPNTVTPYQCDATGYGDSTSLPVAQTMFHQGDRICFRLRVDFPSGTNTRNPIVTDFLPVGTAYEAGSAKLTANNTVPSADVSFNEAAASAPANPANPAWTLGNTVGANRFVAKGAVFEAQLSAIVTGTSVSRTVNITDNLMKFMAQNSAGDPISLRAFQPIAVTPTPDVSVLKGVRNINASSPDNGPNVDNLQVREADVVTFRVDVSNNGTAVNGTAVAVFGTYVWDVLPAGISCAQISTISDSGACNAPGALPVAAPGRSVIRWQLSAPLAVGATRTLTYDMTIPGATSVSTNFVNNVSVRSFQANTNIVDVPSRTTTTYYPASNVDTSVPVVQQLAPVATDPSNVFLPSVAVTKSQATAISESNNNTAGQATIGELVTYTLTATVPAGSTVYGARLTDPMPTGLTFLGATAGFSPTGVPPTSLPLPAGVTLNAGNGTLTWPTTYDNTSTTPQLFAVTMTARVSTLAGNANGTVRNNVASFTSNTAAVGGTAVPARTASTGLTVVVPAPTLAKTSSTAAPVAGQTITYTLTATSPTGRPPSHDTVVIDCVPAGLTFGAYGAPSQGATVAAVAGDGTNGCAAGTTRLQWNAGSVVAGTSAVVTYTATVSPSSAGSAAYTNTATLTGSTLNDGANCTPAPTLERCVTATASRTVTVAPTTITKTTSTPTRAIGQTASFVVTARIPANINYYDAAVIDTLPAGIDPATLTTVSVTCAAACSVPGTPLAQAAGPGGARMVGWLLGDIASAPVVRTVTVTYTAVVRDLASSTRGTTLTNSATVRWNLINGADPTSAGATWDRSSTVAAATVTVLEPHVLLTKAVADSTPEPGQVYGYTVTASNTGAANLSTAYDVVVTDSVPVGVVVDPATISDGGSLAGAGPGGGGTVTWTLPSLAVGATSTLRYSATLAPSASLTTATLTNSVDAVYRSLPGAGRAYDDVTPATAAVTPAFPRITATKAALTTGPAYIASPFGWALTLTNTGAGTAYGVDGVDTLPLNWRYTAGSAAVSVNGAAAQAIEPALSLDGSGRQVLTWANLGDLPPGTAIVITITTVPLNSPPVSVVTAPGIGESVPQVNTLAASAADATGATGNASGPYHAGPATASTRIDAADLAIMKSVSTPFVAGSGGAWSLTVSNLGPDTAVGPFTVTDVVPAGLGFVAAAGTGWSCAYNLGSGTLTCSRTIAGDTLTSGQSFPPITLSVSVAAAVADGTTYVNTATVQGRTYDLVPANNSSTSTATVAALADLAIVKALSGPLVAGQDATYTLDVTNLGPSVAAAPVRVMDTLPTGSSFVSGTGTGWTCNVTGAVGSQTITCDRAALATGAAPQITVVIAVPASQTAAVVNTALVSSPTTDPVPGNNSSTVTSTPGASADLVLTKAHVGQIVAGQPATYRFTTTNDGPSDAAGVLQIVDRLPAGVTFSAVAVADGWTCSVAIADQQLMTCLRAAGLSAGATTVLDVTVAVASDVTGNVHNSATVSSPTPDPLPGNNTATDDSTATRLADLAITKTATGPATAGLTAGFTITVRNLGPSSALAPVTVTDVLPAGLTYAASSSAAGDGWTCAYTVVSRAITCTTGALAAGATAPPITVTTDVDSDAGPAVITNTATVSSPTTDPVPGNNSSSADLTVVDHANVSIVKSLVGTSPVVAGTSTSFHLAVANDGPSDADAIVVNDTLPAGLAPTTAMGTGWSCTVLSQVVTCTRATLTARGSAPDITVTADVSASVPEGMTLTNTGTVSTTTPGDDPADNTSTVQVPVHAVADLTLVKSHLGAGVSAGGSVTYVLQAHNDGPSNAVAPINVVDTLPPGFTYLSAQSGWSCVPAVPDPTGQVVTCTLEATTGLAAGADAALLTMLVHVAPQQDPGSYRNDAIVSSPTDDPVMGNNSAHDTVTVSTGADLSIVKTHTGPVRVGDQLRFTLTVTNSGPSQARDVVVADTMPSGLTYVSASGTGWTCALAVGSQVRCTIPALDSGAVALIDVVTTVQAAAYPSTSNIATVASGTPDPDPTDNTSTDTVTVPPLVDLAITKAHTGPARVGHQLTYTVHVSNAGPTDDPGPVTVTDTLPAGLSYVAATSPGWSCADVGQVVTCTMDTGLTAGGSANLRLVVDVLAAAYRSVVNTAAITSPAEDTDPSNNAAVDPTVVTPQVSLALSKSLAAVDVSTATASWLLTVTNLGPNATVSPVVVVDTLPAQLTYRSYSGVGWTCAAVAQVVTCVHVGTVATHDSASVSLVTAYDAAVGTTVRNAAEIAAGSVDDQNPADDAASATLVIPGGTGPLPHTGADVVSYALLGMVLLMLGAALRLAGRRRPGEIA